MGKSKMNIGKFCKAIQVTLVLLYHQMTLQVSREKVKETTKSEQATYGGFLKWWYPTTMGFPTKKDEIWGVLGVPPFKETPIPTLSSIL